MPILDDVKSALRISAAAAAFNGEINDLIAAARQDLILSGVVSAKANDDTDPLTKRAVTVYVKANFGWDNPDADRLQRSYDMLKTHLTLSQEYRAYTVTFTVRSGGNPLEDATITFNTDEKITNASGQAVFTGVKATQNLEYLVMLDGYRDAEGKVDIGAAHPYRFRWG